MNSRKDVIKRQIYPTIIAFIVFILFLLLFINNVNTVRSDFKNSARTQLNTVTDMIEFNLNKELSTAKIIEVFIRDDLEQFGEIDEKRVNRFAEYIFESSEYIDRINIAPGGVIQLVVPLAENEMMLGYDLLIEKTRREFVERSIELESAVAQGPVETNQGNQSVINRKPIFIEQDGQKVFWGLISVSVDFEKFIKQYSILAESSVFDYVIHVPLADGNTDFYWGDESIYDKDYISDDIDLPELTWQMALYPTKGWYQYLHLDLPYLFAGVILSILAFFHVKKLVIKYQNSKKHAMTDSLTGCSNRLMFDQLIDNKTILDKDSALLIVDLDDFKTINDSFGHSVGDFILKEIVSIMKSCVRESDQVFRIGGDEFVILLKNMKSQYEIETIAQRLIDNSSKDIEIDGKNIKITLSIGIETSGDEGTAIDEMYKKADVNLYRAKEKGKNQFVLI